MIKGIGSVEVDGLSLYPAIRHTMEPSLEAAAAAPASAPLSLPTHPPTAVENVTGQYGSGTRYYKMDGTIEWPGASLVKYKW